jgi:hypothetical protein
MKYLTEQGIIKAPMPIEDMFVPTYGRYDRKTGKKS